MLCEKQLYNVESVETAALDVQIVGVDLPKDAKRKEAESCEYVAPRRWERKRLEAEARAKAKQTFDCYKRPRPRTTPAATRRRASLVSRGVAIVPPSSPGRDTLKCPKVSLMLSKEKDALTQQSQVRPSSSQQVRQMMSSKRPSTSHASFGAPSKNSASTSTSASSHARSAGADEHIFANLPSLKGSPPQQQNFPYRPKTSQYADRVKAIRRLQVQATSEFAARLSMLNIDINDVHYGDNIRGTQMGASHNAMSNYT